MDALARLSGVSARNIRAYRERGLLDPPRREGRSAYYNDIHVGQLATINQLLRRGFSSAHIAQFFATMREGNDLASALGLQPAIFAGQPARSRGATVTATGVGTATKVPGLDPGAEEVRQLSVHGLAALVDGAVVVDPAIGGIVARTPDKLVHLRAILRLLETTHRAVDEVADELATGLGGSGGSRLVPELDQIVQYFGDLARQTVVEALAASVLRRMGSALPDETPVT